MSFSIFAPATIGNVASGFDILGMAVDGLGDLFHVKAERSYSIRVTGRDAESLPLEPSKNTVTIAASAFYRLAGAPEQPFSVAIERSLPLAGGLGSSAASSVAGALAAARLLDMEKRDDLILRAALAGEQAVAGAHLDNIAPCYLGGLVLIQDVETLALYPIPVQGDLAITLITPNLKIKTKEARSILPPQLATARWTKQMAHCVTLALALSRGDHQQLAIGLKDEFAEPLRSTLIPGFAEAKAKALAAGAYGFSISGSGPTCFAICPDRDVAARVGRDLQGVFGTEAHLVRPRSRGAEILL